MSVLELSYSYARSYTEALQEREYPAIVASPEWRRRVIVTSAIFALACAMGYLYMVASIVSARAERVHLRSELHSMEASAQSAEQTALTEGKLFTIDYFKGFGYEEPRSFVTLKRSPHGTEAISISRAQ